MAARAQLRYYRSSPQKVRLVADLVRGQRVEPALTSLRLCQKYAAKDLEKLVRSALANLEQAQPELDVDNVYISRNHGRRGTDDEAGPPRFQMGADAPDPETHVPRHRRTRRARGVRRTRWDRKTHPYGFRLGYNNTWRSRWYADGTNYAELLHEDLQLREELRQRLENAAVSAIDIERTANKLRVNILSGRPGIIIGRKGAEVDKLRDDLMRRYGQDIHINIQEIQRPEIDAHLIAANVARQLERRIAFRRAMRRAIENALRFGAQGIKIRCAGRLNGAEIARAEWYQQGRLPLHTLKADIDYGFVTAYTTYGVIGVKVWVYRGERHRARSRRGRA
jgi:small subunit ribosomal protein S3